MSKDHNTITCTHGKGLACPVCYVQPTSKSSCIAHRASELNLPHVDVSGSDLPRVERFSDLPDGTEFYVAQTYAYGGRKLYQKTMEDGGDHNAVEVGNTNIGMRVTGLQLVIRA